MTTYNTGNPIGSKDPRDLYDNAENLDELVNSQTKDSHTDRLGRERLTWKGIVAAGTGDTSVAVKAAARAADAAGRAEVAEAVVDAKRIKSDVARAEAARDAAFVNADVYPSVAAGLAAVADGEQFQVVEGDEIVRYRRDSASAQSEVARYPSKSGVGNAINALYRVVRYTVGDLIPDSYWNFSGLSVGDFAPTSPSAVTQGFGNLQIIPLHAGQAISIKTRGGNNGRGYAITDKNRQILILAEAVVNTISNPFEYTATEDGYLYVNCDLEWINEFEVRTVGRSALVEQDVDFLNIQSVQTAAALEDLELTADNLIPDSYWHIAGTGQWGGIGGEAPPTPDINSEFTCLPPLAIVKGQRITVRTQGGNTGRGYAITDADRIVTVLAPEMVNTLDSPWVYDVEEDGYLYVNCNVSALNDFEVRLEGDLPALRSRVAMLESGTTDTMLRVLLLSNSFGDDTATYIGSFLDASDIDLNKVCLYSVSVSSSLLSTWVSKINDNDEVTLTRRGGTYEMPVTSGPLHDIIAQPWDMVIMNQQSAASINEASFFPSVWQLIQLYRSLCPNQRLKFAYLIPWAYDPSYGVAPFGEDRYNAIITALRSVLSDLRDEYDFKFDAIIPVGTAIQNARQVSSPEIDGGSDLTRDGAHLQYGAGRYIAAATLFQSIFSPVYNVPLIGNGARHALTSMEAANPTSVAVDESNYEVCQKAAFLASIDKWHITDPS